MANIAQLQTLDTLTSIISPEIEQVTVSQHEGSTDAYGTYPTPGMNRTRVTVTETGAVAAIEDLFNPGSTWAPISATDPRWDSVRAADIAVAN